MATLNIDGFPDLLYGQLQARAERARRSVGQEVVHLLAQAVEEPESLSILELRGLGKELWAEVDAKEFVDHERKSWD